MAKTRAPPSATGSGRKHAVLGCFFAVCIAVLVPLLLAVLQEPGFDPAPLPDDYTHHTITVPEHHRRVLQAAEKVSERLVPGPEDLAYDDGSGILYVSCEDGWIRRVRLREEGAEAPPKIEEWAHVGSRPVGICLGPNNQLLVAEPYKGLLAVAEDGTVRLLTDAAEGLRFGLADGVAVASDGAVYFTDASYKYNHSAHMLDIWEGRPHGRLLRFDPTDNTTAVLLSGLYFANGVAVTPDQAAVVFCESSLRRCRKYHIAGDKRGTVESFLENLPGFPDNIRYDGDGNFWIGLVAKSRISDFVLRYPWARKMVAAAMKSRKPFPTKGSGVLRASIHGEALALYTDQGLTTVTTGIKIGKHLYYVSLDETHIGRIDLDKLLIDGK